MNTTQVMPCESQNNRAEIDAYRQGLAEQCLLSKGDGCIAYKRSCEANMISETYTLTNNLGQMRYQQICRGKRSRKAVLLLSI